MNTFDNTSTKAITPIEFSADEVIANFQGLLDSLDFKAELFELGVGSLNVFKRKKTLRELRSLCVVLWRLALERSFPRNHQEYFDRFLETSPLFNSDGSNAATMRERLEKYLSMLAAKKDTDFLPVADHMAETISPKGDESARTRLKLVLIIRNLYNLIFDKLV